MASPYPMRSRTHQSASNSDGQLFKSFEISPRATSKSSYVIETNKCQKMATAKTSQPTTPQPNKSKSNKVMSILSQQDISNNDFHSNSHNQSSLLQGKYRKSDIELERAQQGILSHSNEQSFVSAPGEIQKDMEKIGSKVFTDDPQLEHKKSYRKQNGWTCYGVPYRKCHSAMEQKVVSIINKIKSGKDCHKEIQTLIDRTKKVSVKELNNKYFVSGIQLISNLALQKDYKDIFTPELIGKLSDGLDDLKNRILAELDNTKGFEARHIGNDQITYQKLQLVRRAYRVLRKKLRSLKRQQVQNKALQAADWFIENKVNDLHLFYSQLGEIEC